MIVLVMVWPPAIDMDDAPPAIDMDYAPPAIDMDVAPPNAADPAPAAPPSLTTVTDPSLWV